MQIATQIKLPTRGTRHSRAAGNSFSYTTAPDIKSAKQIITFAPSQNSMDLCRPLVCQSVKNKICNDISNKIDIVDSYCKSSLQLLDYTSEEVQIITQAITYAERKGVKDEGFALLENGALKGGNSSSSVSFTESPQFDTVSSNGASLYLLLQKAITNATTKAKQSGSSLVIVNSTSNDSLVGSLGFFAEQAANEGLITLVSDGPSNRLALSVPTTSSPLTLTSPSCLESLLLSVVSSSSSSSSASLSLALRLATSLLHSTSLLQPSSRFVLTIKPQIGSHQSFLAAAASASSNASSVSLDNDALLKALKALRKNQSRASPSTGKALERTANTKVKKELSVATKLVHPSYNSKAVDPYGGSMPPLWQTATFAQPGATTFGEYDYTRSGNPTRTLLEDQFAALEGAVRALSFTSGMAALAAACRCAAGAAGDHIVAGDDIYGGTSRLLSQSLFKSGIAVTNVDMTNLDKVRAAIIPGRTKLVLVETPTNPRMQVLDIVALCAMAKEAGALTCVDNSIMAPVFQRPLDLGADICMTSGTKFVGGHGDVTLGLLTFKDLELAKKAYFIQNAEGAGLAPFDCWLALRGLKTMALRMERSAENCAKLANYLVQHPLVQKVNYAGLRNHPGHEIHMRQSGGSGGSLLSFTTGDLEVSKAVVEKTKLFKVTVSFGNVNSLISLPCYMSHASIPAEVRAARGLPDDLVRISAGIEDAEDLIDDLEQAFAPILEARGLQAPKRG